MYTSFEVFGVTLYGYGLCLGAGALAALVLLGPISRARRLPRGTAGIYGLIAIPLALVLSRLLYCLVNLGYFIEVCDNPLSLLWFWDGGLSMSGAIIGLIAAAGICARIQKTSLGGLMDALCAPMALFIAAARFGERFTDLGIGKVVEAGIVTERLPWLFIMERAGKSVEYRMAVYGYEAVFALLLCAVMLIICLRRRTREGNAVAARAEPLPYTGLRHHESEGNAALGFFAVYGAAQVIFESLRDDGHMMLTFFRVGQLFAVLAPIIVAGVLTSRRKRAHKGFDRRLLFVWLGLAVCVIMLVLLEFSLDGRLTIGAASPLRDYAIMLAVCVALCVLPLSLMRAERGEALSSPRDKDA